MVKLEKYLSPNEDRLHGELAVQFAAVASYAPSTPVARFCSQTGVLTPADGSMQLEPSVQDEPLIVMEGVVICVGAICPLLLPSGTPAHVPGVPAATLTQAATPFAVAPEFCSISPCDHASTVGAAADFVANCISGPSTGAEKESAFAVE
jgi:hypothetical protein